MRSSIGVPPTDKPAATAGLTADGAINPDIAAEDAERAGLNGKIWRDALSLSANLDSRK